MIPEYIIDRLRARRISMEVCGNRIKLKGPKGSLTPDVYQIVGDGKEGLLDVLLKSPTVVARVGQPPAPPTSTSIGSQHDNDTPPDAGEFDVDAIRGFVPWRLRTALDLGWRPNRADDLHWFTLEGACYSAVVGDEVQLWLASNGATASEHPAGDAPEHHCVVACGRSIVVPMHPQDYFLCRDCRAGMHEFLTNRRAAA